MFSILRSLPQRDQRVGDGLDFGGADAFEVLGEELDILIAGPAGLADEAADGGGLFVVQFAQDGDEAVVVDGFSLGLRIEPVAAASCRFVAAGERLEAAATLTFSSTL